MNKADEILEQITREERKNARGKLKIFFGMCAGVGKTYSMLLQAQELKKQNNNILVGYIETHGRNETAELLYDLKIIPRKRIFYKKIEFEEFDLEKALEIAPDYILVDELAHTNIPGSKHNKRYQDVLELLENGINVFTTLNIQHIDSRSKTVEQITGVHVYETVPDSIIELADDIEIVDLPIEELLQRLNEGKVYFPDKARLAANNFFKTGNLISLREMALRLTAEKVENDLIDYKSEKNILATWKAGEKLLVAVGSSPFSAELIRWTRRTAYNLKAKWLAVYVRTATNENEEANKQLEKNLNLAKELGAEVITTANTDLVDGLLEIARKNNIGQIIIGKPAKYSIFNYLRKDNYIDRLIVESGDIDIYIVRPTKSNNYKSTKVNHHKHSFSSNKKEYYTTIISILIISTLCFPIKEFLGYQTVGLLLLLNLIILPLFVGMMPIIVGAILNSIIWNFFFIPPLFTFEIAKLHDLLTLILNFVVALSSGILTSKIRKQQALVAIREMNSFALLNYTKELARAKTKNEVIKITIEHIDKNIDANVSFFNPDIQLIDSSRDCFELNAKEKAIAEWALKHNQNAGKFTNNLAESLFYYIPVLINNEEIGVLALFIDSKLSIEKENLINNFITQMSGIYEKELARETLQQKELEIESKKLYDTLLDSISHEFRTPIAVISGASSVLFEDKVLENKELITELAKEIYSATKRIDLLVENLLDINRLEAGKIQLARADNSVNDMIIDILNQIQKEKGNRIIKLDLDQSGCSISIDYSFIKQALFNILINACIYTPDSSIIEIATIMEKDYCRIKIKDNGLGVPDEELTKLFDKFYRVPNSISGGTGLGLSIAQGFILAHKGFISVSNNIPSGLIFDIKIPL